jgi:hypothetical protein
VLALLSVNGQKFRGEGYVALRSSNLLLKFGFDFHQLADGEPTGSKKNDWQCYCNTHEDILYSYLISLIESRLYLDGISPGSEQSKAEEKSTEVQSPELVKSGGITSSEVFSEVEVNSELVLLKARHKDRGDELNPHYEVPKHLDERTGERCPVHLSS